jgi:hypothetical protein
VFFGWTNRSASLRPQDTGSVGERIVKNVLLCVVTQVSVTAASDT